ncbi:MAG TPA: hypothetical protein VF658_18780 [Pyrinomonadaceae bacterium]
MRQKLRSLVVLTLLVSLVCYTSVRASSNPDQDAEARAKVKYALIELGTGPDARVKIKLRDKTELKGYISDLDDDHFTLVQDKTGASIEIAYEQVQKVKGKHHFNGDRLLAIVIVAGLLAVIGGQVIAHDGDF